MERLKHFISIAIRKICYYIFSLIPKEKGLVLCNAWFGQKYIDNTKYVYEYLLHNSNYKVCWITSNKEIYKELEVKGYPVVLSKSIKGIIKQIRAQAVFSTVQLQEYNTLLINNAIHIDLGHGHPIKDPGLKKWSNHTLRVQTMYLQQNHYYGIKASEFAKEKYVDVVPGLDPSHIFISDFARNDVFVDSKLREGKNAIVDRYKNGYKAIVYMPTHRSDGRNVLNFVDILPLEHIQQLCEKYGYVFIIKKHFYHRNEIEDLSMYNRIFDITNEDNIDPQVLLYQADILISDYSACYIDYLLLNRKLCFYQYDSETFQNNERSLYIPFTSLDIAPIAYNREELTSQLAKLMMSEVDEYKERRNNFAPTYFANLNHANGCMKVKNILDTLMKEYYSNNQF